MILSLFGSAVFAGLIAYALRFHFYRWRLLAASYAEGARRPARAVKRIASVVAFGGGWGFSFHAGVTVEVGDGGLALRQFIPLPVFAPPLFLPFDEMQVRVTDWYLNAESFAITMARGNGVELVIDDRLLDWIRAHTDRI